MATQKAIDISNWQSDLPPEVYRRWYAEGVRTVICGTSGNPTAPLVYAQQAAKAAAAGMNVEAYIWIYWEDAQAFETRVNAKLDLVRTVPGVNRVWLDCEDTHNAPSPEEIVRLIGLAASIAQARGFEVGIYTGAWWWKPFTRNATDFGDLLPLWLADYDGRESLESNLLPLGGWTSLYRKQFTEKGSVGGVYPLDVNVELAPVEVPILVTGSDDPFQRGRSELFFGGWKRDSVPAIRAAAAEAMALAARLNAHADWIEQRPQEWGIQEVA